MQLTCSQCNETFKSLEIEKDKALVECVRKLVKHVEGKHRDTLLLFNAKLQEIMANVSGRLVFNLMVDLEKVVTASEDKDNPTLAERYSFILDNYEKNEDELVKLLGLAEDEEVQDLCETLLSVTEEINENNPSKISKEGQEINSEKKG